MSLADHGCNQVDSSWKSAHNSATGRVYAIRPYLKEEVDVEGGYREGVSLQQRGCADIDSTWSSVRNSASGKVFAKGHRPITSLHNDGTFANAAMPDESRATAHTPSCPRTGTFKYKTAAWHGGFEEQLQHVFEDSEWESSRCRVFTQDADGTVTSVAAPEYDYNGARTTALIQKGQASDRMTQVESTPLCQYVESKIAGDIHSQCIECGQPEMCRELGCSNTYPKTPGWSFMRSDTSRADATRLGLEQDAVYQLPGSYQDGWFADVVGVQEWRSKWLRGQTPLWHTQFWGAGHADSPSATISTSGTAKGITDERDRVKMVTHGVHAFLRCPLKLAYKFPSRPGLLAKVPLHYITDGGDEKPIWQVPRAKFDDGSFWTDLVKPAVSQALFGEQQLTVRELFGAVYPAGYPERLDSRPLTDQCVDTASWRMKIDGPIVTPHVACAAVASECMAPSTHACLPECTDDAPCLTDGKAGAGRRMSTSAECEAAASSFGSCTTFAQILEPWILPSRYDLKANCHRVELPSRGIPQYSE